MKQRLMEIAIQNKIDKAVELLNKKEYDDCIKLINEIFIMINDEYGTPFDVRVGLITNDYNKYEYAKPTIYNILRYAKQEAYWEYVNYEGDIDILLNDVIEYFHSSLALHYYEMIPEGKHTDELRTNKKKDEEEENRTRNKIKEFLLKSMCPYCDCTLIYKDETPRYLNKCIDEILQDIKHDTCYFKIEGVNR